MSIPPVAGPHDDLTDVAGVRVGHHHRIGRGWRSGTTVVLLPPGSVGGVDVRGGGPCTRETDALAPGTLVEVVHAVCLSGGSVFGLDAASGVTDWLAGHGVGLPVGPGPGEVAPIVPAACLFDLRPGAWTRRPDAAFGRAAAEDAAGPGGTGPVPLGSVGAGAGARSGPLAGGVGSASAVLAATPNDPATVDAGAGARGGSGARAGAVGVTVAALVVVNSAGSPVDPLSGRLYGSDLLLAGEEPGLRSPESSELDDGLSASRSEERPDRGSTVLVVVATDATFGAAECTRVATASHDGLARAFRPAHGLTDGDVVFAVATGALAPPAGGPGPSGLLRAAGSGAAMLGEVMAAAADVVTRACVRAVLAAGGGGDRPSYRDRYPTACGRASAR